MRKLLLILVVTVTFPPAARGGKSQSYISYDEGGAIVREDKTLDIEARVNLPIFANDELITSGGRAEVRLSDSNVIGIDRATSISFFSILNSREGHSEKTTLDLRHGKVMVYRTHDANNPADLRDDRFHWACVYTASAWYCASGEAVFSLEADAKVGDHVEVFDGVIEVRKLCPARRMRAGERAQVDRRGIHALTSDNRELLDDFEHWFLRRPWRFARPDSYHLGTSLAQFDEDLARHGSWVEVPG